MFLYDYHSKDEISLMKQNTFYCPTCGTSMLLKNGNIKTPHFAHKTLSDCFASEPESKKHLQGKMLLYQFFKTRDIAVEMEKYFPRIRQRADLFVNQQTAIEFQCSAISANDIIRRSTSYSADGLKFIWIAGNNEVNEKSIQIIKIMQYQKAMLLSTGKMKYLIKLDPESKRFQYMSNLFFISGNRWAGKVAVMSIDKQSYPFATPKQLSENEFETICTIFLNARTSFIKTQHYAKKRYQNDFWLLCYALHLDVNNVPAYIGVPILGADCFVEHPVIWQLKALQALKEGVPIENLVSTGEIRLQDKADKEESLAVLMSYFHFLKKVMTDEANTKLQTRLLYDIYCINVRILRK